jgi:hypothetical protein
LIVSWLQAVAAVEACMSLAVVELVAFDLSLLKLSILELLTLAQSVVVVLAEIQSDRRLLVKGAQVASIHQYQAQD